MNTVWLSSYPKSGNTWVSAFLYYYFFGIPNKSSEIMDKIPDIHGLLENKQKLNENADQTIMCKSHFLYTDSHPQINTTAGFIYLLRHPKDVLLSSLHFCKLCSPNKNIDEYQYAVTFIDNYGDPSWSNAGFGTWPQHVESWLGAAEKYPSIFIRYEELRAESQTFRKIIQFLSPNEFDEDRFQTAIKASSFENMRNLEKQEKQNSIKDTIFPGGEKSISSDRFFVNKGAIGQKLSHISPDLDDRFDKQFSEVLELLGY